MKHKILYKFSKNTHTKFYASPFSGKRVVRADRRTNKTKLIVAFLNFTKAPKKSYEKT